MGWAALIGWASFGVSGIFLAYFAYQMKAADAAREKANAELKMLAATHETYRIRSERQIGVLNDKIDQLQKIAVENLDPAGQRELLGSLLQAPGSKSSNDD